VTAHHSIYLRYAARRIWRLATNFVHQCRDGLRTTYSRGLANWQISQDLSRADIPAEFLLILRDLVEHYLGHRFDLLGSGWVHVRHGIRCRGLEGYRYESGDAVQPDPDGRWLMTRISRSNVEESRRIWRMVRPGYVPIDWHLDFKSGYRWSERIWYRHVPFGHLPGVDVKVPWELARMQHLPQLALAHAAAASAQQGFVSPFVYLTEFRDEVLDFVATNPPRFGVNWRSTMDVALRVVNWLVAYNLFRAHGSDFDRGFEEVFERSVYEHGLHIANNLEWDQRLRANHYLANVVGLLFASVYLPCGPETDRWLVFAVRELIQEVGSQFNPDGTNCEASTCYHRLSGEMAIYGTALILGLPEEKRQVLGLEKGELVSFPDSYLDRLEGIPEFTRAITKPNGQVPQIGDNDSGRLLKLEPVYRKYTVAAAKARYANLAGYNDLPDHAAYWVEDSLDHGHLLAAAQGLFQLDDRGTAVERHVETSLISMLTKGTPLPLSGSRSDSSADHLGVTDEDAVWFRIHDELMMWPEAFNSSLEIPIPGNTILKDLTLHAFPYFGLYLFRSGRLYLAVRCGSIGQQGIGGHAHNDQLSIELSVDTMDWITDPGSYLYTPLPARRQQYRSVKAHFAPRPAHGGEPCRLDLGLFRLGDDAHARCLYFGGRGFIGMHQGYGSPLYRTIELTPHSVAVKDFYRGALLFCHPAPRSDRVDVNTDGIPVSPGYGVRYVPDYLG